MIPVGLRFELFVEDVERSLAFYAAALGLAPAAGYDPQGYVPVSAGAVRIGLQRRTALSADHHFRPSHFAGPRGVGVETTCGSHPRAKRNYRGTWPHQKSTYVRTSISSKK